MSNTLRATSQYQNQRDKSSISVYGQALLSGGLAVTDGISGVGLISKGFLWEGYEVWLWPQDAVPVATGWSAATGYSGNVTLIATGWTAAIGYSGSNGSSLVSTAWVISSGSINGEFPA